jgi:chromosomal replication initiator protein DnaA
MDLNPRLQFDSFVVGPSNRLAFTAAQAVAQSPGQVYNPLFLYGRSGLGKTHLLQAVGFACQQQGNLTVRYLTLEEFVGQYHAAVAAGAADALRKSLEETHVLLIDDVQFLAKHREMQSELLRISEAMQGSGRQLLLASDRPPAEIEDLDERLVSRLSGGLLVDLAPPDFETRLAILRRKADDRKIAFGKGVLEAVAEAETASVRELVGVINKLSAFQAVSDTPITPAGAKALLAEERAEDGHAAPAAPKPAAAAAPFAAAADEFSAFLSAVTRTVADSLDSWRSRVGEAVMRWQGEGYRTARLEALINKESLPDVADVLAQFQKDVEALRALAEEAGALDPNTAGHARFRDPDKVEEARAYVGKLREGLIPPPAPTPALTFETYVVGAANEPVVRAARLVVQEPGRRYTPLFLVGPSGVGKTHLLHAIGNALAAPKGQLVACLGAQTFIEDLLAAIDADKVEWWRRRYRKADAFLLDDVQLISGKEQTQDELFNLFNVLADSEKQLVFAADRPPAQLVYVAPRLITRFEGGLVVELAAPDRPMRAELVRRMLAVHGVAADNEVIDFLASRPADSARAVQGLVNRALSAIETEGGGLTVDAARAAIGGRAPRSSQAQAISSPMPSGLDPSLSSREKVVWDWPDIADRLVEELH